MIEQLITPTKIISRSRLLPNYEDVIEYFVKPFGYKSLAESIIYTTIVRLNDWIRIVISANAGGLPEHIHLLFEQLKSLNKNNGGDIWIKLD